MSIIDVDQLSLDRKGDTVDWLETHPDATADDVRGLPTVERETLYTSSAEEWSDPVRLPEGLPPVQSLNPELLPEVLQPWVEDICDRLQCPLDFVAIPAIVALGSVIGRQVGIRPQARTDWTEIPNLWAMTVGRPGTLKSPAIESALAPLRKLSAHAFEEYESTQKEFDLDMQAAQIREEVAKKKARKAAEQDDSADLRTLLDTCDLEPPVLRRYIANDTTPASLGELLRQNPNGLLVLRDELCSLLASLDREDMSDARGMFLSGWNGNSAYTCDRIGRGLNLHIKAMSISLLGSTQPGRISEYIKRAVKGGIGDDGLIQRFSLMVWPNDKSDWIDRDVPPDGAAARRVFETFDRLSRIDAESIDATRDDPDGLPFLRLGDAALEMFVEWRAELETHIRGDLHPALEAHYAKFKKTIPALALITHLADGGTGPISEMAIARALD
ncbi:MAG: DUF3987 domain-containing protein, partial [bacterium]|nr:DUF3987 domain-containing protein [bacterium]